MAVNVDATKAAVGALAKHLRTGFTELAQVLENFPAPNVQLALPSISIFSGNPEFANLDPYVLLQPDAVANKTKVKYIVGQYDFKMQLDLWCGSRDERHALFERFMQVFNSQVKPMGLGLQLTKYHNIWCRFDQVGYTYDDSEAGSQRAEWRVKIDVLAHCKAVLEKDEFVITQPIETGFSTPDNIE